MDLLWGLEADLGLDLRAEPPMALLFGAVQVSLEAVVLPWGARRELAPVVYCWGVQVHLVVPGHSCWGRVGLWRVQIWDLSSDVQENLSSLMPKIRKGLLFKRLKEKDDANRQMNLNSWLFWT